MRTKISQEQSTIKQQLRQREQQHFDKTGKLLTSKTLLKDPTSKLLMDKLKYCKALVDQWKLEKKLNIKTALLRATKYSKEL